MLWSAHVTPRTLPRNEVAPVELSGGMRFFTRDWSHLPAMREAIVEIDRDVALEADGLPVCASGSRDAMALRRVCRKAIVGWGTVAIELALPEEEPVRVRIPITLFNLAAGGRSIRLVAYGSIPIPRPAGIAATIDVQPTPGGRGGWRATVKVPVIAGGYGSLFEVRLRVARTYVSARAQKSFVSARCPDGRFEVTMPKVLFVNESQTPGASPTTVLEDKIVVPCTQSP